MSVGLILGSAFSEDVPKAWRPREFETPFGLATLHEASEGWVLYRHGAPHRLLPSQINYRANTWALKRAGVDRLVVTSSVGVMDAAVPLDVLLTLDDLLMLDNRLPEGRACTMFDEGGGHLVLQDGIFNSDLTAALGTLAGVEAKPVVFAYVGGPRTKTAAENRYLAHAGAQVNSMTVGPEVVLANELRIACAGLVIGHKYSHPDFVNLDRVGVSDSLHRSRTAFESLLEVLLRELPEVEFGNQIYRFGT